MGIKGLTKLISAPNGASSSAPGHSCVRVENMEQYRGKIIALDASLHIYQFMTVRSENKADLRDPSGNPTTHLQGLLSRTCRLLKAGIRPVFVFDGEAPVAKGAVLQKRNEARAKQAARKPESSIQPYRLSKHDVDECKHLLNLLGVPVVQAPSEAEAQCADMCRTGLVYGVSTEDMDTLAFGSPLVIRNLFASGSRSSSSTQITEYWLGHITKQLGLVSQAQFIDLCILCGCDYCGTIPGIGPIRALASIKQHGNIEGILGSLMASQKLTHEAMAGFEYQNARQLFMYPDVIPASDVKKNLEWKGIQEEAVIQYLVHEKGFSQDRVMKFVNMARQGEKLASQSLIDSFFKPTDSPCTWTTPSPLLQE